MSISSDTIRKAGPYTGTGATTAFPFTFKVFLNTDVLVTSAKNGVQTTMVLGTDYTVTLNANQDSNPGGTVNTTVAPDTSTTITITSQVPKTQPMVLTNNGGMYPTVLNDSADRAIIVAQQLSEVLSRTVTLPVSVPINVNPQLPLPVARRGLVWDTNAQNLILTTYDPDAAQTSAASAAASATSAANSLTAFKNIYYGPLSADPTKRPDGTTMQAGDEYFNTTLNQLRVYTGTAWQGAAVQFAPTVQQFSGTGSQTAFTLSQAPGTANALIISISGVTQVPGVDFTVAGTALTFVTAPPAGTNNIAVINFGVAGSITTPAAGSVVTASFDPGAVAPAATNATNSTNLVGIGNAAAFDARYGSGMYPFTPTVVASALGGTLGACKMDFRNPTITTGTPLEQAIASALSLPAVPTTSSLGLTSGQQGRLIYGVAYNGGIPVACVASISGGLVLDGSALVSPTTIGASSNAANVVYSASAVAANSPFTPIGYIDATWTSGTGWAIAAAQPLGGSVPISLNDFGIGQTWQDVHLSRALGTTYYNITGREIWVLAGITLPVGGAGVNIVVAGNNVDTVANNLSSGSNMVTPISIPIGPGESYAINSAAGSPSINSWWEKK